MKIISFIEDEDAIRQILKHLGLWLPGNHDPPKQGKPSNITTEYGNVIQVDFYSSFPGCTGLQPAFLQPVQDAWANSKLAIREESFEPMTFEDAYSQVSPYDD